MPQVAAEMLIILLAMSQLQLAGVVRASEPSKKMRSSLNISIYSSICKYYVKQFYRTIRLPNTCEYQSCNRQSADNCHDLPCYSQLRLANNILLKQISGIGLVCPQNFSLAVMLCFLETIKITMSKIQHVDPALNSAKRDKSANSNRPLHSQKSQRVGSPIKYLLQNNIRLNVGEGERSQQEITLISELLKGCKIFESLQIDIADKSLLRDLCNGVVLIFCENPHIMDIKEGELYIFLEGQGFEYMQNSFENQSAKRYKIYENDQYIMVRKICTNDYFLSLQSANSRYHTANAKKYQLMVDQHTLLGKISDDLFHKVFVPKLLERQRNMVNYLKKVTIFNGLPNSFFAELSKFLEDSNAKADEKVITRSQKSKFVYFIKAGEVQVRHYNEGKSKINSHYYITGKGYSSEKLKDGDTFGFEQLDIVDLVTDKEVVCIRDCSMYRIEKRILAIIITSFDLEFQQRNKVWSEINLNSQVKGQNYCTPEHQLLTKNAERIRSSQRKIRDLKLRFLASKKSVFQIQKSGGVSRQNSHKEIAEKPETRQNNRIYSPEQKRRMIKTTDGRFRSTNVTRFFQDYGDSSKIDTFRREMEKNKRVNRVEENVVSTFQLVSLESEQRKPSPLLRSSNAFDFVEKMAETKLAPKISTRAKGHSSQKLIPSLPGKRKDEKRIGDKYESDIIGAFLDKKIQNEIVKKAEKVLQMNQQLKTIESKNLKRFFSSRDSKSIAIISEYEKKNIASEIVDRMSNLKDNPLLLQIENERRKQQRQLKLVDRRPKGIEDSPRKYKKEDQCLLIKHNQ